MNYLAYSNEIITGANNLHSASAPSGLQPIAVHPHVLLLKTVN